MKKRFLYTLAAFAVFVVAFGVYESKPGTGTDSASSTLPAFSMDNLSAQNAAAGNAAVDAATNASGTASTTNSTSKTTKPVSTLTAQKGDTVFVHYTGKLTNGTVFDSSIPRGQPFAFVLGEGSVIPGWEKGILGMKVGEKKTLTIAPADGYGANGVPDQRGGYVIPPNATLVFDVELVDVKR
jgi:FKBP-type peptidyl-prolyl cis-trans isomerase